MKKLKFWKTISTVSACGLLFCLSACNQDLINSLNTQITEKDSEISDLNEKITDKDAEISDLKSQITEKDSEIETLKSDITTKQNEKDALVKEKEELEATGKADAEKIESLNSQIAEKESQISEDEKKLSDLESEKEELEKEIKELEKRVIVTTTTKTVQVKANTVSYNVADAVALATTWVNEASVNSARAISPEVADAASSLTKIDSDGNTEEVISVSTLTDEEKTALEADDLKEEDLTGFDTEVTDEDTTTAFVTLEDGQTADDIETEVTKIEVEVVELSDGFELPPVRQVYQCPSIDIDDGKKGIYIAYANYTEWTYTNDDPANFGSLVYVRPDETTDDIFVSYGNYKIVPAYNMKSSDDEDFLQFDEAGNMYVAAYDENGKVSIYRYEPIGGTLSKVLPEIDGLSVRNYKVSKDGKWLFLNAMVNKSNHVYAVPTFRPADYVTLYANSAEEYSVENVVVTDDQTVYFFVNDYAGGRRTSGLYKCKFDFAGNTYSEKNIKKEISLPYWAFDRVLFGYNSEDEDEIIEPEYSEDGVIDYEGLLDFIFSFCDDSADKEFRLDKAFAEYSQEKGTYDWWFGNLYTDKTDIEALKFIFEDEQKTKIFRDYCYKSTRKDDGTYIGGNGRFPFERFVFYKDSDETAYTVSSAYYNTDFGSSDTTGGILLKNNEGVFVLKPDSWNSSKDVEWFDYSTVVKVVDNNGNYVFETPESLQHFKCPAPRKEYVYVDPTQSDWYKKPFQTNSDGIFIYNLDGTQIWYYSDGVALNLLANDDSAIEKINSFYVDDDSIILNASYKTQSFTHKIDIATRSLYSYKLNGDLTQIIEVNNTAFEAAKNTGSVGVSIKIMDIADIKVADPVEKDGVITITADKTYSEDGYTEKFSSYKWTCLGKVLNTKVVDGKTDTDGEAYYIEINKSNYVPGAYPILVTARKQDKTFCSCFFNLIIE